MTDREYIKAMLHRTKIKYKFTEREEDDTVSVERGYVGFVTKFTFDKEGNFIDVGAYE